MVRTIRGRVEPRRFKIMADTDTRQCATIWFAILERARNLGDEERAQAAAAKLRELGVEVRFEAEDPAR
jgi:hypothetical protein